MSQTATTTTTTTTTTPIFSSTIDLVPILPKPANALTLSNRIGGGGGTFDDAVFLPVEGTSTLSRDAATLDGGNPPRDISRWQASVVIGTVTTATLLNSLLAGLLIVGLPTMAKDLDLDDNLLLWPASVNSLTCGCTLLLSGSISDVVGGRKTYLVGCFFLTVTTIACSVSRTGLELILFRAAQGVALSLCLPASVQLITSNIPTGTRRNIAFACLGAGQPVGFSVGLVLGGFFVEGIGWRYGYYIGAIVIFAVFVVSIFGMPKDRNRSVPITMKRLRDEIDWIGCLILSTSLGSFSYVFSILTGGIHHIAEPAPITFLVLGVILLPAFAVFTKYQERRNRKVIIPSTLWQNTHFTSLCLVVFLVWSVFQSIEYFLTLYYQSVLLLAPIPTSLRFLPMVITGSLANFVSGSLVARVPANYLVLLTAIISAGSPLILAVVNTDASYWLSGFWATALIPICADVLFTISNLVITQAFPDDMHGIAGGVFNTVSNIGASVGLAITAVIAASVTTAQARDGNGHIVALMEGYRAAFWTCFGASIAILFVVGLGMRKIGKVGLKRD